MSDEVVGGARPRKDFSTASFHREAALIHERFSKLFGYIDTSDIVRAMSTVPGYIYRSQDRLTDGYQPFMVVQVKVPRGKIAIVFPRCTDETFQDGTNTDRSVTLHFLGDCAPKDVAVMCTNVLAALPQPKVAAEHEWPMNDVDDRIAGHA